MPKCKNPDVLHECSCGAHSMEKVIEQIEDQSLPFTEEKVGLVKIRTFDPTAPEHLFKWHHDEEKIIQIPKGVIHRIIKGTSPLSVTIKT